MVAQTTATTATTWNIDASHSLAEFAVKHMMVSTVKGRFAEIAGTIAFDEADITRSSADVTINVASIDTRDEKRDAHLKSADFFDAETFPTITFKSTGIVARGRDKFEVTGDLTIKDVTKPVVLEAEFGGRGATPWGSEVIAFSAETSINRKEFGLGWNVALEAGGVLVGDKVKISIETEAIKQ